MNTPRIEALWQQSKVVLADCALPNGAIVAANTDHPAYPALGEDYRRGWERDAAFQLVGAHVLEMSNAPDIRDNHLHWLTERAEGVAETGVITKRYATNGSLDWRYGPDYQPDQAGTLLWALTETQSHPDPLADKTIRLLANGLVSQWAGTHFGRPTQDLWENRSTDTVTGDVLTYSVSAAIHGLGQAIEHWRGKTGEVDTWEESRNSMLAVLASDRKGEHYLRKISPVEDPDNTLDASLDGLTYPFSDLGPETLSRREETVRAIGRELCTLPDGVTRYVGDTYDGIVRPEGGEATAGRWPLLTFWHVIALNRIGQAEKAQELYHATIERLDDLYKDQVLPNNLIPEQLFADERQGKAILPLAWPHAMFALATKELNLNIV